MIRLALPVALLCLAAPLHAQWVYPRGERPNPLSPPEVLYTGEAVPRVSVTTIIPKAGDMPASLAVVRIGAEGAKRQVVRVGSTVGNVRVVRIEADGVEFLVRVLGTPRRMFVTKSGLRGPAPAAQS